MNTKGQIIKHQNQETIASMSNGSISNESKCFNSQFSQFDKLDIDITNSLNLEENNLENNHLR